MSIKFIGHDLEKALEKNGIPNLYLGTANEHESANEQLFAYIKKKLAIKVDGISISYDLVGKEVNDDDFIYCYLTSSSIKSFKNITIRNTLLTKTFSGQANIIYLQVGEQKFNARLNKDHISKHYAIND